MASRSWNRVELIGNLTRDPELRFTPNGAAVCTFGLATNRTYVSDGERKEEVDFHRLVAWNKLAELCNQLLKKGMRTFISGRLQTRSWEDSTGQTKQTTEIVVEDMIILTPRSDHEEVDSALVVGEKQPSQKASTRPSEGGKQPVEKVESTPVEPQSTDQVPPKEDVDDLPF